MLRPTVSRQVCLGVKPHRGLKTRFLLLSCICGFTDVRRPLWPYITVTDSRLPQHGRPDLRIYISQEQDDPVIPPGSWFAFRRLLRLARLRWRYLPLHPQGFVTYAVGPSILVGKPERDYLSYLHVQENNIKIDLEDIVCEGVGSIQLDLMKAITSRCLL
jgi:hypothetical protein